MGRKREVEDIKGEKRGIKRYTTKEGLAEKYRERGKERSACKTTLRGNDTVEVTRTSQVFQCHVAQGPKAGKMTPPEVQIRPFKVTSVTSKVSSGFTK